MKTPLMLKMQAYWFKFKRAFWLFTARFRSEEVLAVYDDDLDEVLNSLGLYEGINSGKYRCSSCGCTITRENLGMIQNDNNAIKVFCLSTGCVDDTNPEKKSANA